LQVSYNKGGRDKKIVSPPDIRDERLLPRYHPDSRPQARTLLPVTGADRPRISSRLLGGEPSDIPQTGSQPPTGPLYAE